MMTKQKLIAVVQGKHLVGWSWKNHYPTGKMFIPCCCSPSMSAGWTFSRKGFSRWTVSFAILRCFLVFSAYGALPKKRLGANDGSWFSRGLSGNLEPQGASILKEQHGKKHCQDVWVFLLQAKMCLFLLQNHPGESYFQTIQIFQTFFLWLVVSAHLKNISQNGNLPQS